MSDISARAVVSDLPRVRAAFAGARKYLAGDGISISGTTISLDVGTATSEEDGLMSHEDKAKVDERLKVWLRIGTDEDGSPCPQCVVEA